MHPYEGKAVYPRAVGIPDDGDENAAGTFNVTNEGVIDRTAWARQRILYGQGLNWPYRNSSLPVRTRATPLYDRREERWVIGGEALTAGSAQVYYSRQYGLTWVAAPTIPDNEVVIAMAFHPTTGRLVAACSSGQSYYSDGFSSAWVKGSPVFTGTFTVLDQVHYLAGPGLFAAAGTSLAGGQETHLSTSTNGSAWVSRDNQIPASLKQVQSWRTGASPTKVLAFPVFGGGSGAYLSSADGLTWTQRTFPTVEVVTAVAYGDGEFLAAANKGAIYASPDGETWTLRSSGIPSAPNGYFWDLAFLEGAWISILDQLGNGNDVRIRASHDDGVTWRLAGVQMPEPTNAFAFRLGGGGGQAMATAGGATFASQNVG